MPSIKYTWGYFEWGSIYSKVSGGLQWQRFWININSANGFDHLTDSLHRLNYSRRRLGGHITFFGFEAGTGNIRFFTEVGYGLSCAWHSGISLHL